MRKEIKITISTQDDGLPVKTVLSKNIGLSRREISRLKFSNGILLNGESCRVTQPVAVNDEMTVIFHEQDTSHALLITGKPDILYEDEDLVIVNKPYGMVCHPTHEHRHDDMGQVLRRYYGKDFVVRPVGRLDKDVTGIMIYAKNQPCAARLTKQRANEILHKEYLAMVEGIFEQKRGTLTYALEKENGRQNRIVSEQGKQCVTDYQVIEEYETYSLVKISIRTGRTHQIRAGMAHFKHPLLGDKLYHGNLSQIHRPALHCAHVSFKQPFTNQAIDIICPLPDDMNKLKGGK